MINIFDNFTELEANDNTEILNKLGILQFTPETLETMIHVNGLSSYELQILDYFIEKTLKLFPQLFPCIILEQSQSQYNLTKRRNKHNHRMQKRAENKITQRRPANEIFNSYNEKEYLSSCEEDKFLDLIDKDFTFKDIENEILKIVQEKFHQQFLNDELAKLSKIITAEIYLRTLMPEEYINTEDFKRFKDAYNTAINQHTIQIIEKVELMQDKGSSTKELCELLQKELLK
ncbi:hypothetical protein FCU45_08920 [Sulfurimonas crateris]|uniref:Uncharacterized protein n=1 Tax=Sulfurimonas crateris TaxID=2574727 RepID=A0A4V5TP06_9BACT|nr:hypothetical protein [Sulfurimonas crateris]TKI69073.1 hypothetical protein FCU45_08920 [Sulfurimonas crateris]